MGSLMDDEPRDVDSNAARLARAVHLLAAFDSSEEGRQLVELLLVDGVDVDSRDVKRRTLLASVAALLRRTARRDK